MAASVDSNVQFITLHTPLPLAFHGYVWPFMILYSIWVYGAVFVYGIEEYVEAAFIVLAAIGVLQALVSLSCYWSVHVYSTLTSRKVCERKLRFIVETPITYVRVCIGTLLLLHC